CLERLCRQDRRRSAPSAASLSCPSCRRRCNIGDIPGFRGVDVLPAPRRVVSEGRNVAIGLNEYLQRSPGALEPRLKHVLVTLVEDILRLRLPPFAVPTGWGDYVEHVRQLPPRELFDTVRLPLLCREESARVDLLAWGSALHRPGRQGPLPPFPWPPQRPSIPPPSPPSSSAPLPRSDENETLEGFILEQASSGLSHYDLLLYLWVDVWGDRWPPYAPPEGWSECVDAHRALPGDGLRRDLDEEVQMLVLRSCGRFEALKEWASAVRFWAYNCERGRTPGVFPAFPPAQTWTTPLQAAVDYPGGSADVHGELFIAGAAAEVHRSSSRAFERATRQSEDYTRDSPRVGSAFENDARPLMADFVRRVTSEGCAPGLLQHLVDDITLLALPPFVADVLWGDFVVARRRHVAARRQYQRFPFGETPVAAALGDFHGQIVEWVEVHERGLGRPGVGRNFSAHPTFPWALAVESLGVRDGDRDGGPTADYVAAEPVAASNDANLPPPCTDGHARLQQVLYLLDLQSLAASPPTIHRAQERRCFICRLSIGRAPVSLDCGHVFHGPCLEDLMRNTRFGAYGVGSLRRVAVVTCPFGGEWCAIQNTAFFRVECRPFPRLARRPPAAFGELPDVEDLPRRAGPFETLDDFARRVTNGGSAVLAALQADVDRIAFPPFAPGPHWGTLVALYRGNAVDFARARREAREQRRPPPRRIESPRFARCGEPGSHLATWARMVDVGPGSVPPAFPGASFFVLLVNMHGSLLCRLMCVGLSAGSFECGARNKTARGSTDVEATVQGELFLAELRPAARFPFYAQRRGQVTDSDHACGICLRRRGAFEHARTRMPTCGCAFHSSCVRAFARRARYGLGSSSVRVRCLCGAENSLADIPAAATRGAE
ncbi:unnamed protein product, partial [Ectocarpus sp. 6 AP-2014]